VCGHESDPVLLGTALGKLFLGVSQADGLFEAAHVFAGRWVVKGIPLVLPATLLLVLGQLVGAEPVVEGDDRAVLQLHGAGVSAVAPLFASQDERIPRVSESLASTVVTPSKQDDFMRQRG